MASLHSVLTIQSHCICVINRRIFKGIRDCLKRLEAIADPPTFLRNDADEGLSIVFKLRGISFPPTVVYAFRSNSRYHVIPSSELLHQQKTPPPSHACHISGMTKGLYPYEVRFSDLFPCRYKLSDLTLMRPVFMPETLFSQIEHALFLRPEKHQKFRGVTGQLAIRARELRVTYGLSPQEEPLTLMRGLHSESFTEHLDSSINQFVANLGCASVLADKTNSAIDTILATGFDNESAKESQNQVEIPENLFEIEEASEMKSIFAVLDNLPCNF